MSTMVAEHDGARFMTIEEAPHDPGVVYLTAYMTPIEGSQRAAKQVACLAFDRGDLFAALRDHFGLVDPLEALLAH